MLKFVHCADLRFDAPCAFADKEKGGVTRTELKEAFTKMLDSAEEAGVGLVLISGNLFDRRYITKSTFGFLKDSFSSHSGIRFVIMPGSLDHYSSDSVYSICKFGENVHVFKSDKIEMISYEIPEGGKVNIYGSAYMSPGFYSDGAEKIRCEDPDAVNVIMWGGELASGDENGSVNDFINRGFDYVALGSCGVKPGYYDEDKLWYAYPGRLVCDSYDDLSDCGYIVMECRKEEGDFICKPTYRMAEGRQRMSLAADVTGATGKREILDTVNEIFEGIDKNALTGSMIRLTLIGEVTSDAVIPSEEIARCAYSYGMFDFELKDKTMPVFDGEYLSTDPTIRGAFFRAHIAALRSGDREAREKAAASFRLGIAALDGNDIGVSSK